MVQGDELLLNSLFLKVDATVIFFSLLLPSFSPSLLHAESFTLYSFLLDHPDRTLVSHLTVT